jgi:hypothetical protein
MLNLVRKTLFTNLSTNKKAKKRPLRQRPAHSPPSCGALEEGNAFQLMCSMEAYRFDEVCYVARDRGFKVMKRTALHAGPPILQARALQGGARNFLFSCALDAP